jgi:hypothetical protein
LTLEARVLVALVLSVTACSFLVVPGFGQNRPQDSKAALTAFPDLVGGLKATPGCLGVETAQTASGKNVIFAWFEDKKSVLKWYYSDVHLGAMKSFFPHAEYREPLKGVPDDFRRSRLSFTGFERAPEHRQVCPRTNSRMATARIEE